MNAFDILGDPVRRRILELLRHGEMPSGGIVTVVTDEFNITQPAVSQHLRVLRDSGFATVRPEGTKRLYAIDYAPFQEVDAWLEGFRGMWESKLDALEQEIERGKRSRQPERPEEEDDTVPVSHPQ